MNVTQIIMNEMSQVCECVNKEELLTIEYERALQEEDREHEKQMSWVLVKLKVVFVEILKTAGDGVSRTTSSA